MVIHRISVKISLTVTRTPVGNITPYLEAAWSRKKIPHRPDAPVVPDAAPSPASHWDARGSDGCVS
jgi:hypothetical protein